MRINILTITAALLFLVTFTGLAVERFPPPDFVETNHSVPSGDYVIQAEPRAGWFELLDVIMLTAALGLASYLVLKKRSRKMIFGLMAFSLVYFGFWRKGCVCAIGSIQNMSLSIFSSDYSIPLVVLAFFSIPLIFTLFFGRVFCAAVCPLGAMQDFVLLRPVKIPRPVAAALGLIPFVYISAAILFAATGSAFIICRYDPFVTFFRLSGSAHMVVFSISTLLICVFVGRAYCRFLCPYAVLLRWFSKLSWRRVTITPDECIQCRLCEDSCPFDAIDKPKADWPRKTYAQNKNLLIVLTLLLPVLVALGGISGRFFASSWSRLHPDVRLAERIYLENSGQISDLSQPSSAFRATGRPVEELYAKAEQIRSQFRWGTSLVGGFVALCAAVKLIGYSIRKRRLDYEANPAECVACGRCYSFCPREHLRIKKLHEDK